MTRDNNLILFSSNERELFLLFVKVATIKKFYLIRLMNYELGPFRKGRSLEGLIISNISFYDAGSVSMLGARLGFSFY